MHIKSVIAVLTRDDDNGSMLSIQNSAGRFPLEIDSEGLAIKDSPKYPGMGIVRFELSIHDGPIDIGAHTIEWYAQLSSDTAGSSITADKEFGFDCLFLSISTLNLSRNGMTLRKLFGCLVIQELSVTFNEGAMSQEVSDEDPLQLALGNDMKSLCR